MVKVLAAGRFRYSGDTFLPLTIVEADVWPGSGDYEDPEDIREDKIGKFCKLQFGIISGGLPHAGRYFHCLEDAISCIVSLKLEVVWDE